jgi:hypothetical protein
MKYREFVMKTWKHRTRVAASAAAVLAMVAGPLRAQEAGPPSPSGGTATPTVADDSAADQDSGRSGYWELGAFIGLLNDEPEYHPDEQFDDQFRRDALIGARGGYTLPFGLFLQAQGSNSLVRIAMPRPDGNADVRNMNTFFIESVIGYNVALSSRFDAFLGGGAGVAICSPDGLPSETDFAVNYGVGGRYLFAHSRLAVRGDVRMHQVFHAMEDTRDMMAVAPVGNNLFALELSLGISVFLGR